MRSNAESFSIKLSIAMIGCIIAMSGAARATERESMSWQSLPDLPDTLGVAGPFAGVHNDGLIVAGGANFPLPVWETTKAFHDRIHVLEKNKNGYTWRDGGKLPRPIAYGAAVSTPDGIVCLGGCDTDHVFSDVFIVGWDALAKRATTTSYPSLPRPCAYSAATLIGDVIYLAGGQSDLSLESAMNNLWSLDLSQRYNKDQFVWKELPPIPGPSRALNLTVSQHNGNENCVYVMSGRRQSGSASEDSSFQFLKDVWEFTPSTQLWRQKNDVPRCVMAGTSIAVRQHEIMVPGGATEELFFRVNELKDAHPGFVKNSLLYNAMTDRWTEAGETLANQVTTIAVRWGDDFIIPSGELRPRVRTPKVFRVSLKEHVNKSSRP